MGRPDRGRLDELERLAGPEDDVLVPIEPEEWEGDVGGMEESLEDGWEPPPLLAEYQDGRLLLQDGNHRFEALTRARRRRPRGSWCSSPTNADRDAFRRTREVGDLR